MTPLSAWIRKELLLMETVPVLSPVVSTRSPANTAVVEGTERPFTCTLPAEFKMAAVAANPVFTHINDRIAVNVMRLLIFIIERRYTYVRNFMTVQV
jgi:hypothetical protein